MKAIVQERYGSPDDLDLREVDEPVIGDDEVLVCVRAASVHPDVWHVKPDNATFEQAASVPTSGFIALQNLRGLSQWRPGQKVLINGAGGGMGALALQLTKAYGARVTAVDSTGKLDMLRLLGADEVIDYTQEDFPRRGVRYDLIFDVPGNRPFPAFKQALEPDGRYVPIGHEGFGAIGKRVFGLIPHFLKLMVLSRFVKQLRGPGFPMPTKKEAIAAFRGLLKNREDHTDHRQHVPPE